MAAASATFLARKDEQFFFFAVVVPAWTDRCGDSGMALHRRRAGATRLMFSFRVQARSRTSA
jgi:hypothetical protein